MHSVLSSGLCKRHSGAMRSLEPGISRFRVWCFRSSRNDGENLPRLRKPRRALFHIGAHGFGLVGAAQQLLLLDGFGEQRRTGIDGQFVQHALGGADRIGTLAGDFARDLEGRSKRGSSQIRVARP